MVFKVCECIWELKFKKNLEKTKKWSQESLGKQKNWDKRAANRKSTQNIGQKSTNIGSIWGQRVPQKGDK